MSKFLNSKLAKLEAYVPGEQPQDKAYIKLNTNESPFAPSKNVLRAVNKKAAKRLRLYCDPECKTLRKSLADLYNVDIKNIFVSNGSDDILNFAFLAFGEKGVLFPDITYGFYDVFANLHGLDYHTVPLLEDFTVDTAAFCGQNKLIVIANPNAPTGLALSVGEIENIVKSNPESVVVVDEAYVDFGTESCIRLVEKYDNLLVCQTFSKSRSMAGARLGFAIANSAIIEDLEKIKYSTNPYNINTITQLAGIMAACDNEYYMENCKKIIKNRQYTQDELVKLGFSVLPSSANFIFAKSDKIGGKDLYLKLKEKGVLIRHFEKERICEFNRITIGSKREMKIFISKVKEILGEL